MAYRYDQPPQRWDRERFERDYQRYEDRERERPRIILDERIERRGPQGRFEERERYVEDNRPSFLDQRPPPERTGQALTPYRRPRPQFIRRQSSLDTFDRRPMPRYGDEEYKLPPDVPIPLPIRKRPSPSRERYVEEYEDVRYHDSEEDYRDFRVREERKGDHRSRSRMRSRSVKQRRPPSSSSDSSFEEIEKGSQIGRKGRTKMPKRLVHKKAVIEKGLPFEDTEEFIIVLRALDKVHIDEIIEISKKYRTEQVTYKYGETPKKQEKKQEKKEEDIKEVKKEEIRREDIRPDGTRTVETIERTEKKEERIEQPTHQPHGHQPQGHQPHGHQPHGHQPHGGELVKRTTITTIDPPDHHRHHQDLAVVVPHRQSEESIRREIEALEAERRALKLERSADWRLIQAERIREGDWEGVERERLEKDRKPRNVIRVDKDKKGRLALVRSAH